MLGPMVVALVSVTRDVESKLKSLGVKDSKTTSLKQRLSMEQYIRQHATEVRSVHVSGKEIDERRREETLDEIELDAMASMIASLKHSVRGVVVDSLGQPERCQRELKATLRRHTKDSIKVLAEPQADKTVLAVSAASIIAKTERDRAVAQLQAESKLDMGSGYPSDPRTIAFMAKYHDDPNAFASLRNSVRESWNMKQRGVGGDGSSDDNGPAMSRPERRQSVNTQADTVPWDIIVE